MIIHDLTPAAPDYVGGSIVNLMASLGQRFAAPASGYQTLAALDPARFRTAKRIALVVIDGLGAELLDHLGADSALNQLRRATLSSVYPPTTASAITTFMSGLAPQQHALTGWFMHFRQLGAVTAVLPFMPRFTPTPLTSLGMPLSSVIDVPSFAAAIAVPSGALLPHDLVDSAYSSQLAAGADRRGYRGLADFAAQLSEFCRGSDLREYLYAYWPKLDYLAHVHGPSGSAVASHFAELDAALAPLAEVACQHGTLLIVTADHGFIDSGPEHRIDVEQHPELAQMLSLPLCGEPRSAYAYVRASCVRAFEDYVTRELAHAVDLYASEQLIDAGWFGLGSPHPELAPRLGDFVLCMRDQYTLRDRIAGERDFDLRGVHGGTSRAEQYVPLLVAGP